jgi:hypothetical protein
MKSWNHASDEAAPLIAPLSRPIARDTGRRIRIRALVLTLATCVVIFGLDALFPDVKNGHLPTWKVPGEAQGKPFQWSQVSYDLNFEYVRGGKCDVALYHACSPLAELDQVKSIGYTLQRLGPFLLSLCSKGLARCYRHYLSSMSSLLMLDSTCRFAYFRMSSADHIDLQTDRTVRRHRIPQVL